jgi:hypothetical protein
MSRIAIVSEFWEFLRSRKKYWMLPLLIVFVLLAVLMILASEYAVVAPFVYVLG